MTSKDTELQAEMSGCLRILALLTADIPTGGTGGGLLYVRDGSGSTVGPESKLPTT
jgi:hypothetical protein